MIFLSLVLIAKLAHQRNYFTISKVEMKDSFLPKNINAKGDASASSKI